MEWNEEKAQEIVKKYKNRFSLRLTFKIVRILAAILILFWLYMMAVSLVYHFSNVGLKTEFYQKLAIDWTYPELSSDISSGDSNEITPFLTQKIEIPLQRRIGKKDYVVSQFNLSKPIFTAWTQMDIAKSFPYDSDRGFHFYLPADPKSGKKLVGNQEPGVWDTLDKVHEGNVADLAFSTDKYYTPKELLQLLAPYDIDVIWMPLYMGEMKQFTEGGWGGGEASISLGRPWGLAGFRMMDEDHRGGSMARVLVNDSIEESQEAMLHNMQRMLTEKKGLAERLLGTEHLQERYDYLNKNGFQAYGAVVTGPVKELLKLKEVKGIHSVYLGEMTHWNWSE